MSGGAVNGFLKQLFYIILLIYFEIILMMSNTRGIAVVTADIIAHQVLLNRVPEQATEDRVRYQIYY